MEERPVSAVIRELISGVTSLVRSEIHLARAEMTQNAKAAARRSGATVACALVAWLGINALIASLIIGLGNLMDGRYWLSSLIVALVLIVPSAIIAMRQIQALRQTPTIPLTRTSIETDREIVNERVQHLSENVKQRAS